jgi:hypothetical protein
MGFKLRFVEQLWLTHALNRAILSAVCSGNEAYDARMGCYSAAMKLL